MTDNISKCVLMFKEKSLQEITNAFHYKVDVSQFFDKYLEYKDPCVLRVWNACIWLMLVAGESIQRPLFLNTLPDPNGFKLKDLSKLDCIELLLGLQRKRYYNVIPCNYWDEYWTMHDDMVLAAAIKRPRWRLLLPEGLYEAAVDVARMSRALDAICDDGAMAVPHPTFSFHLKRLEDLVATNP